MRREQAPPATRRPPRASAAGGRRGGVGHAPMVSCRRWIASCTTRASAEVHSYLRGMRHFRTALAPALVGLGLTLALASAPALATPDEAPTIAGPADSRLRARDRLALLLPGGLRRGPGPHLQRQPRRAWCAQDHAPAAHEPPGRPVVRGPRLLRHHCCRRQPVLFPPGPGHARHPLPGGSPKGGALRDPAGGLPGQGPGPHHVGGRAGPDIAHFPGTPGRRRAVHPLGGHHAQPRPPSGDHMGCPSSPGAP